jgi:hypothetical protein
MDRIWSLGIAKARCMLKVFDSKELISQCAKIFNPKHRLIEVGENGKTLIPITPSIFRRMLQIPSSNKVLKLL